MKKYIQRNEAGQAGKRWHSDPHCPMIRFENTVITAPDSMLRAYGITKKCEACQQREDRIANKDNAAELREWHGFISVASQVLGVQIPQTLLRADLTNRSIPFSLRTPKGTLARFLVMAWLREGDYDSLASWLNAAILHWSCRIERQDRHRPKYYVEMRARSEHALSLLNELKPRQKD